MQARQGYISHARTHVHNQYEQKKKRRHNQVPVTLNGLKNKVGNVKLYAEDGDEEALHVVYYLIPPETWNDMVVNDRELKSLKETKDDSVELRFRARQLSHFVKSWDLIDDKTGEVVPLEEEAIYTRVYHTVIIDVLVAIAEDRANPNPKGSETP